ncbi:MAG: DHA2 family efflux MFS transporter permease subunit [Sphingomonadaceae bacterium]|nr:DHA2 family efflux MFS transporter permease subunit [Sphingomonadaceae bacterium]
MTSAAVLDTDADARSPRPAPEPEKFVTTRTYVGFGLMALGMFMAILDIQIVAASLGQIQAGLAASEDEISWVQTSYLVAEVVMIPLSGYLMRALGLRDLFAISAGGFVLTSVLCATASSINEMILFRAAQGFIGGAMIPTAFAASFTWFPRRLKTKITVATALLITLAPAVGPTIGGLLTDATSWHWIFLINIVPGTACVFGVLAIVPRGARDPSLVARIDLIAVALLAAALGGTDYVPEEGARNAWFDDGTIVRVALLAAVGWIGFAVRNLTNRNPLVDLSVCGNRNFVAASVLQLMTGVALFGITFAYPVFLGRIGGLSATQIGETVFVTGATMMVLAPVAGMIARKTDPRLVCSAGFIFLAASAWTSRGITADWRFMEFLMPQLLRGAGLILLVVSTTVIAFATLSDKAAAAGSPLFVLVRNVGGAIGLALVNTMVIERGQFHWARLTEGLTPGNPEFASAQANLSAIASARGLDGSGTALRMIAQNIQREATVMSFIDLFQLLTWGFLAMAVIPHLLKRPPTFETAPVEAH